MEKVDCTARKWWTRVFGLGMVDGNVWYVPNAWHWSRRRWSYVLDVLVRRQYG
jgi:hypothetical protein